MKYLMLSKPLENLSYPELADTVADLGMDGVDLTVRSPGHVLPERVKNESAQGVAGHTQPWIGNRLVDNGHRERGFAPR